MLVLDLELFRILAPEFDSISSSSIIKLSEIAIPQIDESVWRSKSSIGLVYLTAHTLKMTQRDGRVGGITSETVGSLSRSYGGLSSIDGALDLTSYGVEFKRIRKQLVISPVWVN